MTDQKPIILFTTPRTGSTLMVNLLYHVGKNYFEYKRCLYEYFFIESLYKSSFQIIDEKITRTSFERTNIEWCQNKKEERLKRLDLLKHDSKYIFKIFPTDLELEIEEFITKTYDIIYLERHDIEQQFISYLGLLTHNISHFQKDESKKIKFILYKKHWLENFVKILSTYNEFKSAHPSKYPTIYYEDFINQEKKEEYINRFLGLNLTNYSMADINTKFTPYNKTPFDLIVNKDQYLLDKHLLDIIKL